MSSWYKAATGFAIDGSKLAYRPYENKWRSAYGVKEVSSGHHQWKIKIIKSGSSYIYLGVSSDGGKYADDWYPQKSDAYCYCYYGASYIYNNQNNTRKYGEIFKTGDVITIDLNLNKQSITFYKNDKNLGIAYNNVQIEQKYRLAISMHTKDDMIEVMSYLNLSDDDKKEEEEIKNDNYIEQFADLIHKQCGLLTNEYSNNKISNFNIKQLGNASKHLLKLNDDIQHLKVELTKYESQLLQSQNILTQKMKVDTNNYKQWTFKEIELWLNGLENGRYCQYIDKLIKSFQTDNVAASNLPELDQGDLRAFGVQDFNDRKDLRAQFQRLKQENEGLSNTN